MLRWLAAGLAGAVLVLVPATPVDAAAEADCDAAALRSATVTTRVAVLTEPGRTPRATSQTTVTVPRAWRYSADLLSELRGGRSRIAARCLFGPELRSDPYRRPAVSMRGSTLTVLQREEIGLVQSDYEPSLGFWRAEIDGSRWRFRFLPDERQVPDGLRQARWRTVEFVAGGTKLARLSPAPAQLRKDRTYVWQAGLDVHGPPARPIEVDLLPDQQSRLSSWLSGQWYLVESLRYPADLAPYLIGVVLLSRLRRRSRDADSTARETRIVNASRAFGLALAVVIGADLLAWAGYTAQFLSRSDAHLLAVSAGWLALTVVLALVVWLRQSPGAWRWLLVAGTALAGLAGGSLLIWLRSPATADPVLRALAAGTVGGLQGLLGVAVLAGVAWSVVRTTAGRFGRLARRLVVLSAVAGGLAVVGQAAQRVARVVDRETTWRWWFEPDPLPILPHELLTLPWDLLSNAPVWALVILGLLAVLRARSSAGRSLDPLDVSLVAFLFVTGVVSWPDWYLLVPLPVGAFATYAALLVLLRLGRRWAAGPAAPLAPRERRTLIDEHLELEAAGRRLEQRRTAGDLADDAYEAARAELVARHENLRTRAGLPGDARGGPTALDVALAQGPGRTWWENGVICGKATAVVALPFALYFLVTFWRGAVPLSLTGGYGVVTVVESIVEELSFWLTPGLVLGLLWQVLPGRRGYLKPITLVAAYGLGALLVQVTTGQGIQSAQTVRLLGLYVVLTVAAAWADARQLQAQRTPWTSRFAPLAAVYRLQPTGGTIVLVLTQVAALISVYQQLRNGIEPILTPPKPNPGGPSANG